MTDKSASQGDNAVYAEGDAIVTNNNQQTSIGDHTVQAHQAYITYNYYNPPKSIPKHLGTLPFSTEIFLGREEDMVNVRQRLQSGEPLLLVNGQGGIGKTTLAAHYYQKHYQHYQHLAWVYAETGITPALLTLALSLKLSFPPESTNEQRLPLLLKALAGLNNPCLLVIDNANDLPDLEKHYTQLRRCPNFHILLTSRITEFEQTASYAIKPLAEAVAIELFQKHYPKLQADEHILLKNILVAAGYNTLVIELIAKHLHTANRLKTTCSLMNLLSSLQSQGLLKSLNKHPVSTIYHAEAIQKATPEQIIAAMYDLSGLSDGETALLSAFAVLPAEYIAYEILESLLSDSPELDSHLLDLYQKGWLDKEDQPTAFKISPVVQEICLTKNQHRLFADCKGLVDQLLDKLEYQPGTGHLLKVSYQQAGLLSRYGEPVVQQLQGLAASNNLAVLCDRLGRYHSTTGSLQQALLWFENEQQIFQQLCTENPEDADYKDGLAIAYQYLGITHTALGDLAKALSFYEGSARLEQELFTAYPDNVAFKNGLASAYSILGDTNTALGNLDMALSFYEESRQLREELYTVDPYNVEFKNGLAIAYSKLGNTQRNLGDLVKALGFYEQYLKLSEELFTALDNVAFKNGLAIAYSKLGNTHIALGDLARALGFYEESAGLAQELSTVYPDNMGFKNGLAIAYQFLGNIHTKLGDLAKALGFYEEYARLAHELSRDNPDNVKFKNSLAIAYLHFGYYYQQSSNSSEAKRYYQLSQQLYITLVQVAPGFVEFQKNLNWVNNALSAIDQ